MLESEILEGIDQINTEGKVLKSQRDELVGKADPDVFQSV